MNETQIFLLEHSRLYILPEILSHEAYQDLLEAMVRNGNMPMVIYCRGDGGSSRTGRAMVDLIQHHGSVVGMLAGEANSSHGIVWASCKYRYVFPYGELGVHMVAFDSIQTRVDAQVLRQLSGDYDQSDRYNAEILAGASNQSPEWWYELQRTTGSAGIRMFPAREIIQMGMAKPISEYKLDDIMELHRKKE